MHVFGPAERFAYAPERRYTPADASSASLESVMNELGMSNAVLVQPSPYADDHRCLLAGLEALKGAAGVAALAKKLDTRILGNSRIVGLRLNLHGMKDLEEVKRRIASGASAAADNGWHLELHLRGTWLAQLDLESLPVEFVLDHMGRLESADENSIGALERLLDTGRCWVKLSGADRVGLHAPEIARRLLATRADRLVWGSDWPHVPLEQAPEKLRSVDTSLLLAALRKWTGGGAALERVLVDNPARLYARQAC